MISYYINIISYYLIPGCLRVFVLSIGFVALQVVVSFGLLNLFMAIIVDTTLKAAKDREAAMLLAQANHSWHVANKLKQLVRQIRAGNKFRN